MSVSLAENLIKRECTRQRVVCLFHMIYSSQQSSHLLFIQMFVDSTKKEMIFIFISHSSNHHLLCPHHSDAYTTHSFIHSQCLHTKAKVQSCENQKHRRRRSHQWRWRQIEWKLEKVLRCISCQMSRIYFFSLFLLRFFSWLGIALVSDDGWWVVMRCRDETI